MPDLSVFDNNGTRLGTAHLSWGAYGEARQFKSLMIPCWQRTTLAFYSPTAAPADETVEIVTFRIEKRDVSTKAYGVMFGDFILRHAGGDLSKLDRSVFTPTSRRR